MALAVIACELRCYFLHEVVVDQVNDLQMSREQVLKHLTRPLLQSLWQHGVIRVAEGLIHQPPSLLPWEMMLVHEDPQQLRDRQCGMGVIELDGDFVR